MADIIKSISAEILVHRAKEKLKPYEDAKKFEVDRFFYWVLRQIDGKVEFECPAPKEYYVGLRVNLNKESFLKIPCVKSRTEEYLANFIEGSEFFDVMREVAKLFNEMEHYRAEFKIIDEEQGTAEMKVFLEL